ncbi:helix-turn-helix domain-containing protein [Rahnella sp. PD12R]|uniref:phage repressor protein CI n=1 Tax=Rahnella sp. PD12R TaxID=2855688 RepID=UPI001C477E72|nr:phage repressor protein CI [Rahnella sp. PD12R]MBV6819956.1 helix-turn-helix domain-containing protein [Rahnella sp. PD12R]
MRLENAVAADVLERILSAYGFTMQKELSDKLGIAKSNVASWLQRGQVPGNVLVQCALDTGADVQWLVTGIFANANKSISQVAPRHSLLNGQSLITKMLQSGGKPALQRILEAYGFKTQKELSEYLGISTGTISTWVRRGFFPGDVVITCALDTGYSLEWLATGEINSSSLEKTAPPQIPMINRKILLAGKLDDDGFCYIDQSFVPDGVNLKNLNFVRSGKSSWLIEMGVNELSNGSWLLDIDGILDVYEVSRRPGNKLNITGANNGFECKVEQVTAKGMVVVKLELKI